MQVKHRHKKEKPLFVQVYGDKFWNLSCLISHFFYLVAFMSPDTSLPFVVDGDVGAGMEHPSGTELGFGTGFG